jgi:hypothetical protein
MASRPHGDNPPLSIHQKSRRAPAVGHLVHQISPRLEGRNLEGDMGAIAIDMSANGPHEHEPSYIDLVVASPDRRDGNSSSSGSPSPSASGRRASPAAHPSPFRHRPDPQASLQDMANGLSEPYLLAQLALKQQERDMAAAERKYENGQAASANEEYPTAIACFESGLRYIAERSEDADDGWCDPLVALYAPTWMRFHSLA